MKRMTTLLLLLLALTSCSSSHRCTCSPAYERTVNITDSVVFRVQNLDVPLPKEFSEGRVAVEDTSVLQTSVAEAKAWVEDGRLHQQLRNRSEQLLKISVDVPVYIHTEKEYITRTVTREVEKPLGWFRKALMYAGAAAVAIALVALIVAVIRHKNTLLKLFKHN